MFDFANPDLSYYGLVVLIVLMFAYIVAFWVWGANSRSAASKELLGTKNGAVKLAKAPEGTVLTFAVAAKGFHYWRKEASPGASSRLVVPLGALIYDSAYHAATTVFLVRFLDRTRSRNHASYDWVVKFILFFLALNLVWSALLGIWGAVIIVGGVWALLWIVELIV